VYCGIFFLPIMFTIIEPTCTTFVVGFFEFLLFKFCDIIAEFPFNADAVIKFTTPTYICSSVGNRITFPRKIAI
jgi:hypothetical protein